MPLKKTNGLYRGKVRIGVTQDGKPIDKFVSGKTVKEAIQQGMPGLEKNS